VTLPSTSSQKRAVKSPSHPSWKRAVRQPSTSSRRSVSRAATIVTLPSASPSVARAATSVTLPTALPSASQSNNPSPVHNNERINADKPRQRGLPDHDVVCDTITNASGLAAIMQEELEVEEKEDICCFTCGKTP